jgi:hypothetical protein
MPLAVEAAQGTARLIQDHTAPTSFPHLVEIAGVPGES